MHVYDASPVIDTNVNPAGNTSVTDQPANASTGPLLCGTNSKVTVEPGDTTPVDVSRFVIDRSNSTRPASSLSPLEWWDFGEWWSTRR